MQSVKIYTFNPKNQINEFDVFVLCKGLNSGNPLEKPCPNSFVIACKNQAQKDFYTTLLFGLHQVKHFQILLVGSVIPFLRIADFKHELKIQSTKVLQRQSQFESDIAKIKLFEAKEKQYYQNMLLIQDLKKALMYRHFRR